MPGISFIVLCFTRQYVEYNSYDSAQGYQDEADEYQYTDDIFASLHNHVQLKNSNKKRTFKSSYDDYEYSDYLQDGFMIIFVKKEARIRLDI